MRWTWWQLIGGCAVLALPSVLRPGSTVGVAAYLAGLGLIAAALVTAARALGPEQRRPWLPWIAAMGCALTGSLFFEVSVLPGVPAALGGVAPAFWIAFYVPMTLAVLRMIEAKALPAPERSAIAKDVAVVTAAAAAFAWYLLIEPALRSPPVVADRWALFSAFAFPLGDVTIVALVMTVLLVPGARTTSERLIAAGFGATLVVDVANAFVPALSANANVWLQPSYLLINATLAAAVVHPSRVAVVRPSAGTGRAAGMRGWRMALLGVALCGVGLTALVVPDEGWERIPSALATVVMVVVILSRLHRAIADLEGAERRMRHQATHDQLTGLANRSELIERMHDDVLRSPTLFFVDLDGFKAVNDTCGHAGGDSVLIAVAERLTGIVRSGDTVARLGGDEFVVVCAGLPPEGVTSLAKRIEQVVAEPVLTGDGPVTVGASIGVLTLPLDAATGRFPSEVLIADLLQAADAAMYEAKRSGGGTRIVDFALSG